MRTILLVLALTAQGGVPSADASVPNVRGWADSVFGGAPSPSPSPSAQTVTGLVLRRQDFGHLTMNKSVVDTPIKIGGRQFKHGLGTQANSEIAVSFPAGTAKAFKAMVGVDNNYVTHDKYGTVEFSVEVAGRTVYHSPTLHGGGEPMPVNVEIPPGVDTIVLKVDATPDGPSYDHADWAEAQLVMNDGSPSWLDEFPLQSAGGFWPASKLPFSFVYDGESSEKFLSSWKREMHSDDLKDRVTYQVEWTDPKTGLKAVAIAAVFKDFPAVEWFLRFENTGTKDTPILEKVQALNISLDTVPAQNLVLDKINGDNASTNSFAPSERELKPGESVSLAPVGGRPSSDTFPIFNLQQGSRGFFTAIGWTGQWAASVGRNEAGATHLQTGLELTHLLLHPGESIRTPRILLLPWSGDRMDAHNEFRRLLLAHYLPRPGGQPVKFAFAAQSFMRWAILGARPFWDTEAGQIAAAKINHDLGCDTLWLDAGWFEGDYSLGAGNWFPKRKEFPNGLAPVGEACEKLGLKFLLWYDPERVAANTQIAREHPDFILPAKKAANQGGLFDLGNPQARRWMTDLLIREITEYHIHTYRNDFNLSPLSYWRKNDPTNRQGITEIRYVEGLYAMWDEMLARFPDMHIDDCASGGRRIDLEMIMRSVVQTRSDSVGVDGRSDWDQSQAYGLSLYLPVHATIGRTLGTYECRSSAAAGFNGEWDILDDKFPMEKARKCIAEMKENRDYWSGDYYPLTPWTMAPDQWIAWQLHLADQDKGIILAFRRLECPYPMLQVNLRGLKPDLTYSVTFIDEEHHSITKTMSGRELATLELQIPARHQSLLVRYARKRKS